MHALVEELLFWYKDGYGEFEPECSDIVLKGPQNTILGQDIVVELTDAGLIYCQNKGRHKGDGCQSGKGGEGKGKWVGDGRGKDNKGGVSAPPDDEKSKSSSSIA